MIRKTAIALAVIAVAGSASAQAVQSSTSKFFIGAALNGSSLKVEGDGNEREQGGGLSLQLGYGFTPKFALFLEATGARLEDDATDEWMALAHVDLGARYHFTNPAKKLVPFLELALTARTAGQEDVPDGFGGTNDIAFSGGGVSFGGGLLYFFNPKFAFNGSLKWTAGEFSTMTVDNVSVTGDGPDATSSRLSLGFTWFPKGG